MLKMSWDIMIGSYQLKMLESVEIHQSVDLLSATAKIKIPGVVYNQSLNVEDKVKVGDKVIIKLGYDDDLRTEFEGYLIRIDTDDSTLTFNCEDNMYLTRKPVRDKRFGKVSIKDIAAYCLSELGENKGWDRIYCTYTINYQSFVIKNANIYNVLKKLKEETNANIFMKGTVLNIHPPYIVKGGDVIYDFSKNIESCELKYRKKEDRKYEVTVEGIGLDGKKQTVMLGIPGEEKRTVKVQGAMSKEDLKERGKTELKYLMYDGYEGSVTGWLIPYVEPTYSAKIVDKEYDYKEGTYYVISTTTNFSSSGGVRKVELGRKVANG